MKTLQAIERQFQTIDACYSSCSLPVKGIIVFGIVITLFALVNAVFVQVYYVGQEFGFYFYNQFLK